jgi:hypothetical protein
MAPPTDDEQTRPFAAVLAEIGGGRLHARLSDKLAELTAAVAATGKKGQITLTIKVEPVAKGDHEALRVQGTVGCRIPEGDDASPVSVFYASDSGALTRDNPNQPQLPLVGLPTRKGLTA